MIFHSLTYLVFLAIVLATYWSLPRRARYRELCLLRLGASLVSSTALGLDAGGLQLRARDGDLSE